MAIKTNDEWLVKILTNKKNNKILTQNSDFFINNITQLSTLQKIAKKSKELFKKHDFAIKSYRLTSTINDEKLFSSMRDNIKNESEPEKQELETVINRIKNLSKSNNMIEKTFDYDFFCKKCGKKQFKNITNRF